MLGPVVMNWGVLENWKSTAPVESSIPTGIL